MPGTAGHCLIFSISSSASAKACSSISLAILSTAMDAQRLYFISSSGGIVNRSSGMSFMRMPYDCSALILSCLHKACFALRDCMISSVLRPSLLTESEVSGMPLISAYTTPVPANSIRIICTIGDETDREISAAIKAVRRFMITPPRL